MLMLLPAINALAGELETATQAPFEATTALTEDGGSAGGTDVALPTKHGGASLAAASVSILAVPRSLTQISPELIEDFNLTNVGDLVKLGAGTQTYNYYGLPGTPIIRGAKGGTFLDGMLRAYQRSEMPVSFAAVGSIEVVKGPAPVHLSPTLVGGFVNLIPKKPDFEKAAGSLEFSADNWGSRTSAIDYGTPFTLPGGDPAALRIALTRTEGDEYYENVNPNHTSAYTSLGFRPSPGVSVLFGAEYVDFKSTENPGWNRPTQDLIDKQQYIIGEPLDQTSAEWAGTVDRNNLYGSNPISGLSSSALALPSEVAARLVPQFGDLADMLLLTDTDGLDKYVYTEAYFANDGRAVTQRISGKQVLSASIDFADSRNFVAFGNIVFDGNPDRTLSIKTLFETIATDKQSSYGYAVKTEQTVIDSQTFIVDSTLIPQSITTLGVGARYTDAVILQDFFDEPFSRRDILLAGVSANTRLLVGRQRPADGLNLWSPSAVGGANVASELLQLSAFATIETRWVDRFSSVASLSTQYADFDISLPAEAERARAAGLGPLLDAESGDSKHIDWSLGANFALGSGTFLYGHYQEGTSIDPTQGGAIFGEQNFGENMLMEIGFKSSLLDGSLLGSLATHTWEQVSFTDRSGASENLEGEGIELEFSFQATEKLMFIGSYTWQEVTRINAPEFRTMPAPEGVAEDAYIALNAGTLLLGDFGFDNTRANTDYVYPGAPQDVAKLFVIYHFPIGFSVSGGPIWQDNFYLNMDNTIELPSALIWNFSATYATDIFQLRASVENAFSEDYYLGADPLFSANTLVTKAAPASYSLTLTINF
jgi:iron complex outermembrane recepter protein